MKYDLVIGIDPDVDKIGWAELYVEKRNPLVYGKSFPRIVEELDSLRSKMMPDGVFARVLVCVEAGWLNQSNWHLKSSDSKRVASAKGNAVGRNHEVGRIIVQMAKHYGLNVEEVSPLKKCWKGKDGKITQEEIEELTGLTGRTSQEMRDAALIAWVRSGLPMRMRVR